MNNLILLGKFEGVSKKQFKHLKYLLLYIFIITLQYFLNIFILIKFTLQSQLESKNLLQDIKQVGFLNILYIKLSCTSFKLDQINGFKCK